MPDRQMTDAHWADLVREAMAHRDEAVRQRDRIPLAILAGERVTFFGAPAEITIVWPEGTPMGLPEAELRAWAARELARFAEEKPDA